MKRILFVLVLFLAACSQEIPTGLQPLMPVDIQGIESSPVPQPAAGTVGRFPPASTLPAGPISMIAIGDSLTEGDGDETRRGFPGRLLARVDMLQPGSTMTNFGKSGWNSDALIKGDQGLMGQLPRAVEEAKITASQGRGVVVFVWIGSNDLWYLYEYGGNINDRDELLDVRRFSTNIDTILFELRSAGAQVIVALLDDQSKRPIALEGKAFLEITPAELARMSVQVQRYNEIIAQKAAEYGALTVDFYSIDIFTNPATLYDDGNHPNGAGYDIIAQMWFDVLTPIMP